MTTPPPAGYATWNDAHRYTVRYFERYYTNMQAPYTDYRGRSNKAFWQWDAEYLRSGMDARDRQVLRNMLEHIRNGDGDASVLQPLVDGNPNFQSVRQFASAMGVALAENEQGPATTKTASTTGTGDAKLQYADVVDHHQGGLDVAVNAALVAAKFTAQANGVPLLTA